MPNWLNRRSEKRKPKTVHLWEREFSIVEEGLDKKQVTAFVDDLIARHQAPQKADANPPDVVKVKTPKEAGEEAIKIINNAKQGADEIRRKVTESLRSVIDRAVTDAEQVATSIKTKARTEAEEEAARIIEKARQSTGEIQRRAETLTRTEKEAAPPAAKPKVSVPSKPIRPTTADEGKAKLTAKQEAKQKADEAKQAEKEAKLATKKETKRTTDILKGLLTFSRKQKTTETKQEAEAKSAAEKAKLAEISQPQTEPKTTPPAPEISPEKPEERPVQTERVAAAPETAKLVAKEPPVRRPPQKPSEPEPVTTLQTLDSEAIYEGEVELAIAVPVDPAALSRLFNYLQSTPDMKVLYIRGSWDRGTIITVVLDKPMPLVGMITKISGLKISPEAPEKDSMVKGTSGSLLVAKKKEAPRLDLVLKVE